MCEDLSSPVNGMIMLMGRTPGSIAMYSCDMGFRLNGEMTRTCQTDGNWSNEEPTCICEHNFLITVHSSGLHPGFWVRGANWEYKIFRSPLVSAWSLLITHGIFHGKFGLFQIWAYPSERAPSKLWIWSLIREPTILVFSAWSPLVSQSHHNYSSTKCLLRTRGGGALPRPLIKCSPDSNNFWHLLMTFNNKCHCNS